jgi:hypothetical protein
MIGKASFEIPNSCKIGFEIKAAVDPVMAKTKIMVNTCQLLLRFHRCFRFSICFKKNKIT